MRRELRPRTVPVVAFLGLLALLVWARTLSVWAVAGAAALLGLAAALEVWRTRAAGLRLSVPLGLVALGLALATAGATAVMLERGDRDWAAVQAAREHRLGARLDGRMLGVVQRSGAAAELAAGAGREMAAGERAPEGVFSALEAVRRRTSVDAVALVDGSGRPVAWAGDHRGPLPRAVLERRSGVLYPGGTLFSYLYTVEPVAPGLRAIGAVLVQAGPPVRGRTGAVGERFAAVTGELPRFGSGGDLQADWTLAVDGAPVLHARWPAISHGEWRSDVSRTGRRVVFALVLLGLGFLWVAWLRSLDDRTGISALVPMIALTVTLMVAPLRAILGMERVFSPGFFLLPVPGDLLIEGLMVVLLPMAALVATFRPAPARPSDLWLRLAVGASLAGGGFAIGAGLMTASAGEAMLLSGAPLWYLLMPTTVVLLAALTAPLMPVSARPDTGRRPLLYAGAGVLLSAGFALAMAAAWRPGGPVLTPMLLAWSVPFLLLARAAAGFAGRGDRLVRWLAAGWVAATAVVPHLWVVSQSARLAAAEVEVAAFGARSDPFLTYLLMRFPDELERAAERGEQGADLLYAAWVESGLGAEPYPLEISLWDEDLERVAHLPLGVRLEPGSPADRELREILRATVVRDEPENIPATATGVGRFLTVPLRRGGAVTVAVAPRASLRPASPLAMLMEGQVREGVRLELLPIDGVVGHDDAEWVRTTEGWRKEMLLREGPDVWHAHLELRTPPAGVAFARAALLVCLALGILALLWVAGRVARGDPPVPPGGWLGWSGSFRVRLIVALFAFFLLPTAVFGWAAYRALADEVTRAARQVAERAVVHSAAVLPGTGLVETARRAGEDLLYYEGGALRAASMPEAQELGLYSVWMPGDLYRRMRAGEAMGGSEMGELAGRSYMVSYRRLQSPDRVVAVPVWLAARDVAVRQREFAHLVLFGTVVGGLLSLVLSVLVGRALSRPINDLRRAAAAVGRGRLRVRLPEQRGEFGEVFAAFNRMTRGLRRARARELRTARILAWGEMARQVAHEIKNPLTPIKLSVQHIRRAYDDRRPDYDAILHENVDQILSEIDRLTDIARAFSRYGAPQEAPGETEPIDIAAVAREALTLYQAPDRSVRYELTVDNHATVAAARSSEVREVLLNLLENARMAVGEAGRIEVRVGGDGRFVRLDVRDDGEGIPSEQLPRIFEPHFSTRSSGTGLGLAIVRRLVEGWGGAVSAESEAGAGTTIRVLVPRAGAADVDTGAEP